MNKKAYTLTEILITIFIVMILGIMAIGPFVSCVDKDRSSPDSTSVLTSAPVRYDEEGYKYYQIQPETEENVAVFYKEGDKYWRYIIVRESPLKFKQTRPFTHEELKKLGLE